MPIITISRGCFSHGKEIAQRVASRLGYECVSREILLEAAKFFHTSEKKLLQSVHDSPSILERITHGREKYLLYIQAALLEHVKKDNVVYHGHAGHLLLRAVPHLMKVRVIAEMDQRIAFLQEKEHMSRPEAVSFIEKEDHHRALWTHSLYSTDLKDPALYDLVVNIGRVNIEDACELICCGARLKTFQATTQSLRAVTDLAVSSHVKAVLQDICEAEVNAVDGFVRIKVPAQRIRKFGFTSPSLQKQVKDKITEDLTKQIVDLALKVPGAKEVVCEIGEPYYA
jgi:cytidylate kinase